MKLKKINSKVDYSLFLAASFLIIISILYSLSLSVYSAGSELRGYINFNKQLIFGIIGITIMYLISFLSPEKFIKYISWTIFIIFALVIVLMPLLPQSIVPVTKGAARWIHIGVGQLSPTEFFKIGFIWFLSLSFHRKVHSKMQDDQAFTPIEQVLTILPHFTVFTIAVLYIGGIQKDLGNTVVLLVIMMTLLIASKISWKVILSILGVLFAALIVLIVTSVHRVDRVLGWWGSVQESLLIYLPLNLANMLRIENPPDAGQVSNSLNAIYNGGFFGTGIGDGNLKLGFLSEIHTDFILAGISEEFGFFGLLLIIMVFIFIIYKMLIISQKIENPVFKLFVLGIAVMLFTSFLINAYGITSIIPIKGIAVPLLSYGGSSLLASCIAIGLVLSISKEIENER